MSRLRCGAFAVLTLFSWLAHSQDVPNQIAYATQVNLEVRISGLPSLKAQSSEAADVLATALATVLRDKELCCDRNSALEDRLPQSDPVSLKDVAAKLQGRQLRSDGRQVMINAEFFAPEAVNAGLVISAIRAKHAPLMVWNSRLYVICGVVYDEAFYNDGTQTYAIRKFLLLDTRYSDSRREASFNRDTDDLSKVQGLLFVTVAQ